MHLPQGEQKVKFLRIFLLGGEILKVGVVNLVVLAVVLRATTKKGCQLLQEKVHLPKKSRYACAHRSSDAVSFVLLWTYHSATAGFQR